MDISTYLTILEPFSAPKTGLGRLGSCTRNCGHRHRNAMRSFWGQGTNMTDHCKSPL